MLCDPLAHLLGDGLDGAVAERHLQAGGLGHSSVVGRAGTADEAQIARPRILLVGGGSAGRTAERPWWTGSSRYSRRGIRRCAPIFLPTSMRLIVARRPKSIRPAHNKPTERASSRSSSTSVRLDVSSTFLVLMYATWMPPGVHIKHKDWPGLVLAFFVERKPCNPQFTRLGCLSKTSSHFGSPKRPGPIEQKRHHEASRASAPA